MTEINWWLMKSEPEVYGLSQLKKDKKTLWDGIRNYQARNFMRTMSIGDQAFFYHSNCKEPGIVGLMEVTKLNLIDPTQFDSKSKYFDSKSTQEKPIWDCVELTFKGSFTQPLNLHQLKEIYSPEELLVVRKGNRLSILPVKQSTATDLLQRLGELH